MAVALPAIAVALTAVGTGVAVYGAVQQGQAADDAAKRTQRAENANAKAASDAAALEAQQVRRKNLIRLGSQRADAAKSGVLIDDSAADVIYDSAMQGELEALSITYSGAQASAYSRQKGLNARAAGRDAKSASYINASGSLIGGLGQTAQRYGEYRDARDMPKFKR